MSSSISKSGRFDSRNFDLIKDSMLQSDELPLSEVIDCDQCQEQKTRFVTLRRTRFGDRDR